jgi:hypothetical protein
MAEPFKLRVEVTDQPVGQPTHSCSGGTQQTKKDGPLDWMVKLADAIAKAVGSDNLQRLDGFVQAKADADRQDLMNKPQNMIQQAVLQKFKAGRIALKVAQFVAAGNSLQDLKNNIQNFDKMTPREQGAALEKSIDDLGAVKKMPRVAPKGPAGIPGRTGPTGGGSGMGQTSPRTSSGLLTGEVKGGQTGGPASRISSPGGTGAKPSPSKTPSAAPAPPQQPAAGKTTTQFTAPTGKRARGLPNQPDPKKWIKNGGSVQYHPDGSATYTKNGISVTYNKDGYPDFSPHAIKTVRIKDMKGNETSDFTKANNAARAQDPTYKRQPDDHTWHHGEDGKTMQLIPSHIHAMFPHSGGVSAVKSGLFQSEPGASGPDPVDPQVGKHVDDIFGSASPGRSAAPIRRSGG